MHHNLNINGKIISASSGDTLVDAALTSKILIPHDCASGQCETCRVRVAWGKVDDAGTAYGDTVLACQARVTGDATIAYEEVPAVTAVAGVVESISPLSDNVIELVLHTPNPLPHRPGQYARLGLEGFPPREYSFSAKMDGTDNPEQVVFQIRKIHDGKISSALGNSIRPGHRARLQGPYGSAFLRQQETGPLVLTSSGTGFAPMWSLARAVTLANDNRDLTLITGIGTPNDLYMKDAINWLGEHSQKKITIVSRQGSHEKMASGTADEHLPRLNSNMSVHVAGNPKLVERVRNRAMVARAHCHCDPFTASRNTLGWRDRMRSLNPLSGLRRHVLS